MKAQVFFFILIAFLVCPKLSKATPVVLHSWITSSGTGGSGRPADLQIGPRIYIQDTSVSPNTAFNMGWFRTWPEDSGTTWSLYDVGSSYVKLRFDEVAERDADDTLVQLSYGIRHQNVRLGDLPERYVITDILATLDYMWISPPPPYDGTEYGYSWNGQMTFQIMGVEIPEPAGIILFVFGTIVLAVSRPNKIVLL